MVFRTQVRIREPPKLILRFGEPLDASYSKIFPRPLKPLFCLYLSLRSGQWLVVSGQQLAIALYPILYILYSKPNAFGVWLTAISSRISFEQF